MITRIALALTLTASLILSTGCGEEEPNKPAAPPSTQPAEQAVNATWTYNVDGMTCENCENSVEKLIAELPGVAEVNASHDDKTVVISGDEAQLSREAVDKAFKSFPAYTAEPADAS